MTNRNTEIDYSTLTPVLDFVLSQALKDIHTAMPGIVEAYDATTRRAQVRPALRLLTTNGKSVSRAPIVNAPVLFPYGARCGVLFPLAVGDSVLIIVSERGLTAFKQTFAESDPDPTRFFSAADGVILPGFGQLGDDPDSYIAFDPGDGTDDDPATISINSSKVLVNGRSVLAVPTSLGTYTIDTTTTFEETNIDGWADDYAWLLIKMVENGVIDTRLIEVSDLSDLDAASAGDTPDTDNSIAIHMAGISKPIALGRTSSDELLGQYDDDSVVIEVFGL